jgi:hypothetical protein
VATQAGLTTQEGWSDRVASLTTQEGRSDRLVDLTTEGGGGMTALVAAAEKLRSGGHTSGSQGLRRG